MQIFHNRPFALAACLFAVCAVVASGVTRGGRWLLLAIAFLSFAITAVVCLIRKRIGRRAALALLCLGGVCLSLLSSVLFFNIRYQRLQALVGEELEMCGTVRQRLYSKPYEAAFAVKIESINGVSVGERAFLECSYASPLQVGDRFVLRGVGREFTKEEYFDETTYRLSDGAMLAVVCAKDEDCTVLSEPDTGLFVTASKLNTKLSYALRNRVGGEAGGVAAALLLGNRTWLSPDTVLSFRRAGVSHLLALSGLHVSILIGFLELILKKLLRLPKAVRAVLIPLFALGYLALTGFSPSTQRAVLMCCVLYLGFLLRTEYDAFTALSAVLSIILLVTPYAVFDLSLWMSFLAAGAIVIFYPAVTKTLRARLVGTSLPTPLVKLLLSVVGSIAVGIVASLALMLLSALVFGEIALLSVPATMALSLLITPAIVLSLLSLLFPFLGFLPHGTRLVGEGILAVTRCLSDLPDILLPATDSPTLLLLALMTGLMLLFAVIKLKKFTALLTVPLAFLLAVGTSALVTWQTGETWQLSTIPTSEGELRLYTRQGDAVLINDSGRAATESVMLKNAATQARVTEIDDLVFCRYYNQANYFLYTVSGKLKVRTVHFPKPRDDREAAIAARLTEEAELHGMTVLYDAEVWLERYDTQAAELENSVD